MIDPIISPQGSHPYQLITLREPNRVGIEERWNMVTLH
jgi:hypothetical protein